MALHRDGTVAVWGPAWGSVTNVPPGLTNIVTASSGQYHVLALAGDDPPLAAAPLVDTRWTAQEGFSASRLTHSGRVYALEYRDSLGDPAWKSLPLVAGTGRQVKLTDANASGAQRFYRVRRW